MSGHCTRPLFAKKKCGGSLDYTVACIVIFVPAPETSLHSRQFRSQNSPASRHESAGARGTKVCIVICVSSLRLLACTPEPVVQRPAAQVSLRHFAGSIDAVICTPEKDNHPRNCLFWQEVTLSALVIRTSTIVVSRHLVRSTGRPRPLARARNISGVRDRLWCLASAGQFSRCQLPC
jgi:hypothetical protein